MQIEYKHTLRVPEDHWLLRIYLWAWDARIEQADFCRLFWGTVLLPLNLIVRVLGFPFYLAALGFFALRDRAYDKKMKAMDERLKNSPPPTEPSRATRILMKIIEGIQWGVYHIANFCRWAGRFLKYLKYLAVAAAWLVAGASVVATGYLLFRAASVMWAAFISNFGQFMFYTGVIVGTIIGVFALLLSMAFTKDWLDRSERWHLRQSTGIRIMVTGFKAAKSNTCPKIEIQRKD